MGTRDSNRISVAAKISVRSRKNTAEGGCGGNSAAPERIEKEASPAALLVQSRTPKKSFVFLLEEKIGRAQIRNRKQNFSLGWRVVASGGGLASLVPFKVGSREVYNYSSILELVRTHFAPTAVAGEEVPANLERLRRRISKPQKNPEKNTRLAEASAKRGSARTMF